MTDDERTLRNTRLMARYRQAWEERLRQCTQFVVIAFMMVRASLRNR